MFALFALTLKSKLQKSVKHGGGNCYMQQGHGG